MKNAPILHRIEFAAYLGVKAALRTLPHTAARRFGTGLGELAYRLVARRRQVALSNLALAFPELEAERRAEIARASFRHLGASLCDSISVSRFDAVELCRRLTLEGWELLERARRRESGICLMTAHLGCWEIAADVVGLYTGPLHVVGRPLDNPLLDRELRRLRGRFGNQLLDKRGSVRQMIRTARDGGRLGILIDQRVRAAEGIEVPFFGHPAVASPVLARISLRTGAPVVPLFVVPRPGGRYRLGVQTPIEPGDASPEPGEDEAAALTRRYLEVVEAEIRRAPELWMWMHDRWKR